MENPEINIIFINKEWKDFIQAVILLLHKSEQICCQS